MKQQIIITALQYESKKDKSELANTFKKEGFKPPKFVRKIGGYTNTTDCIFEVADKDVPKLAVHWFHLSGLFRWYPTS